MSSRMRKIVRLAMAPSCWLNGFKGVVPTFEHGRALRRFQVRTVLDVGANKGQFALFAIRQWPAADLHCFEPFERPRSILSRVIPQSCARRVTIYSLALGDEVGRRMLHVASRHDSSSLFPIGRMQTQTFGTTEKTTVEVDVERLDSVVAASSIRRPCLLKIDVQGGEFEALKGAQGLIDGIDLIYVECSYIELYDGQRLLNECLELLSDLGYLLVGVFNQKTDRAGRAIQADFLFELRSERRHAA